MSEYSQGVCEDGAAVLKEGAQLTIEEILAALRRSEQQAAEIKRLREEAKVAVADYHRWVVPHYGAVDGLDALAKALEVDR